MIASGATTKTVALEDVAKDITVGFVGPMATEYRPSGIPFLRSQNIEPFRVDHSDIVFIGPEFHQRLKKSELHPGDVVIVRTGKPGTAAVIPDDLPLANCADLVVVRPGPELDPWFLTYYVNSVATHHVYSHIVGAVQQHFNVGSARSLKLILPDLDHQRKIVSVLKSFDDKIALNQQMNATLEATARAIFKSWFVDFDPVRAKIEGRTYPLAKEILDLFPDSFQDSPLGEIPKGWEVGQLSSLTSLLNGFAFSSADWISEGVPVVKIGSVKPGVIDLTQVSFVSPELAHRMSPFRLDVGDLLIGMTGYVGEVGLVPPTDNLPMLNQRVAKFLFSEQQTDNFPYVYCLTRGSEFKSAIENTAHGTAQSNISAEQILKFSTVIPSNPLIKAFSNITLPMLKQILRDHGENYHLTKTRDTLLPKLMSGSLRAGDL